MKTLPEKNDVAVAVAASAAAALVTGKSTTNSQDRGILLPSKHENCRWIESERLSSCFFRCCYCSPCYEQ
jgi:hypothetical protein